MTQLQQEKRMVLDDLASWIEPLERSHAIHTTEMLNAIIAKCEHLKTTDF